MCHQCCRSSNKLLQRELDGPWQSRNRRSTCFLLALLNFICYIFIRQCDILLFHFALLFYLFKILFTYLSLFPVFMLSCLILLNQQPEESLSLIYSKSITLYLYRAKSQQRALCIATSMPYNITIILKGKKKEEGKNK